MADLAIPDDSFVIANNDAGDYNTGQFGVFGKYPLSTPKYAFNDKGDARDGEFRETLARMYVSLAGADQTTKDLYVRSLPADDRIKAIAKVLVGSKLGQGSSSGFIDFFLQQANESFNEKLQVDEVLGDNYVAWFFGQQPPTFQYSGSLLNSQQDDQTTGFALAYQHIIRGTALAKGGALLRLRYDNRIVTGTVVSMTSMLNAENELICPFSFTLLVKEYVLLTSNLRDIYIKRTPEQFVELATSFAGPDGALSKVGKVDDARVRTQQVTPQTLAATPVVGPEEPAVPVDPTKPSPQQIADQFILATQPAPATGDFFNPPPAIPMALPTANAPNL